MYAAIIGGHLGQGNFEAEVVRLGPALIDATLDLHAAVTSTFLPSAIKFQYQFNLRELSAIAQVGVMSPIGAVLWRPQCDRHCSTVASCSEIIDILAQGLCRMTATHFPNAVCCVRLWIHECERVFADRLISEADNAKFAELRLSTTKKYFGSLNQVCDAR